MFALMTKLAAGAMHDATGRRTMGKEWLQKVKATCPGVKFMAHYAILGPYDFMDIYEAPDVETAHTVSMLSRAGGAVTAESWQLMEYDDFLKLLERVS
jgi:uncharacterized protein with GYD domain